jgi:hypothetical protein
MDIENDTPEEGASLADTLRAELSKAPPIEASEEIIEDGPSRDEVGRFAPKPEGEQPQAQPVQPIPDQTQGAQPPASWSKEDRAVFATLPPNVQELLARREREMTADYTRKTQEIAEIRRFSDDIRPVFEKNQQLIAHAGAPPAQVMDQLLGMYGYSQRDPAGYLKWAAQSLGVDLSQLTAPTDEYVDPAFNELRNQITPLNQQIQSVTQYIQQQEAARQEQERQQTLSTIDTFAQEKDASGTPLRPYFEQVRVAMGRLLQPDANGNAIASDLQDAYEKATWADPSIRAELQKPKLADQTVQNAKKVAAMNVRSSGGASVESAGSLRDTLREEFARRG